MAVSGTISSSVIKITTEGAEQSKAQLKEVAKAAKEAAKQAKQAEKERAQAAKDASKAAAQATKETAKAAKEAAKEQLEAFKTIGSAGATAFAGVTGAVSGFVSAADPYRWTIFTQKLEILSIHIGRIFLPLLEQVTEWLDQLINYFKNLTDEQRESILYWTKVVLVIAGTITALATFIIIGSKVVTAIKAIRLAMILLGSAGPVRLIVLIGLLIAGIVELLRETGGLDFLWKVFVNIGNAIGDTVKDILAMVTAVTSLTDALSSLNPFAEEKKKEEAAGKEGEKKKEEAAGKEGEKKKPEKSRTERFLNKAGDVVSFFRHPGAFITGKIAETGVAAVVKASKGEGLAGAALSAAKGATKDAGRFVPHQQYKRVEMFGLEEGFKRAQQGAMFDPAKLAERERDRLAAESASSLRSIDGKIKSPSPAAEGAY